MGDYKSDFVIITALNKPEFEGLKRIIRELPKREGYGFLGEIREIKDSPGIYVGRIGPAEKPFRFYAGSQLYPGMVSAATLATKMIQRYKPRYIVMLGIAAGFADKKMHPGSVLIADFVANYQQGKTSKKGFQRDGTGLPLNANLKGLLDRHKDDIMNQLNDAMAPLLSRNLQAYIGPIVTGSQVVASQAIMDGIKNSLRKVVGVEMEGFAIFQATTEADDPKPLPLLIKSVCDFGNESKNDKFQKLAAYTSAYFFLKFALDYLEPTELDAVEPSGVELTPWQHMKDREEARLAQLLNKCKRRSLVKFISITGRSFLDPEIKRHMEYEARDPFENAIKRGAKFQGVLLDPKCTEAKCRSEIESPEKQLRNRLLMRDATSVTKKLERTSEVWKENLRIGYSQVGLASKLWLFKNEAYIEPYHFGKQEKDRSKAESALCGFSHIWIKRSAPEYELLEDHFEQLWRRCKKFWPAH